MKSRGNLFKKKKKEEENFKIYPDKIGEVKEKVFELVIQKKQAQHLANQKIMRRLLQTEARIPYRLALRGISFCD